MKSVQIGDLKNHLSAHLRDVRKGEEIIVRDRNLPVARIIPYVPDSIEEQERMLIAAGKLRPPKNPPKDRKKWLEEFWALPRPNLDSETAKRAVLEEREEGW
ncbi:MAG TPA: type II toxin-antitoxin system prevent-host-death family antitoxin [Silvibacterium sp.]|jgi:prevent-host-death family protein|nr:type II toxin-antitoxin system prevent-host-death family antitoxin [Silvibacterium sp.]